MKIQLWVINIIFWVLLTVLDCNPLKDITRWQDWCGLAIISLMSAFALQYIEERWLDTDG